MLIPSGQPEILRAFQKDDHFLRQFHRQFTWIIQNVLGIPRWFKYKGFFQIMSNFIYPSLTTLCNLQTLGEEYTGIFQTHSSGKKLQKKPVQLIMILLDACSEQVMTELVKRLEKYIENLPKDHPLTLQSRKRLIQSCKKFRIYLPLILRFHKALFYLNGDYYQFGKRLTQTRYMLIRHWLKDGSTLPAFRLLGIVSFIHLSLYLVLTGLGIIKSPSDGVEGIRDSDNELVSNSLRCSLCLNTRKNTSTIPCGHLFCWGCIIYWLQEEPRCPICRKKAQPSRVVLIQNY